MILAVVHDIAAGEGAAFARRGGNDGIDLFADRSDVVCRVVPFQGVDHVNVMFAGIDSVEGAVGDNRHIVADQNTGGGTEQNKRIGRAVVRFVLNGRAGNLDLARGNRQCGAAGPIFVVRGGYLNVNSVDSRIGVGGHFGNIVGNAVERVADGVGRIGSRQGKGVFLSVVNVVAAGKADAARDRGDRGLYRIRRRNNVVGGVVAGEGVGNRDIVRADSVAFEDARRSNLHVVADGNTSGGAKRNGCGGGAVIDLVERCCAADFELAGRNGERGASSPVGVIRAADCGVNGIGADVGKFRNFGGVGFAVNRVEDGIGRFGAGNSQQVRRTVIDESYALEGDIKRRLGNARLHRFTGGRDIVNGIVAGEGVGNRDVFIVAGFGVGKLAGRDDRNIVADDHAGGRAERDDGICAAVIDFVGGCGAADFQLDRSDLRACYCRHRIECVISCRRAGKSIGDINIVEPDVLFAERTAGGHADIVALNDSVNLAERNFGIGAAVVNLVGNSGADDGNRTRSDFRRKGFARCGKHVIRRIGTADRILHRDILHADVVIHKRAGCVDQDFVTLENADGRSQVNRNGVGAIVDFAVNLGATDRDFTRGNGESRFAGPIVAVGTGHLDVNSVDARIGIGGHFGNIVSFAVERIADGVSRFDADQGIGVRGTVVSVGAAGKGDLAGRNGGDFRLQGFVFGNGVILRLRAGNCVSDIHVMNADCRIGKGAGRRHDDFVAGKNADNGTKQNGCVGGTVEDFILRLCIDNRQLDRSNRCAYRLAVGRKHIIPRRSA